MESIPETSEQKKAVKDIQLTKFTQLTKLAKLARKWAKRTKIFYRLFLYKIGLDQRPVFGVLTVNAQCDFRCRYCFADYYQRHDQPLPLGRMKQTIDELADYGVIYLNVHGGEALIRNDIGDILNYALRKGMFVNLITNGTLLKKKWDEVKNVDTLCISLDGREEHNDQNRGKGAFKIATEAIDFALSQGMPVRIGMTITHHTQHDLEWLAEWAKTRNIYIQPFLLFDQDNLPQELWMTPEENREALRTLIHLKKKGYPIFYSFKTLEYALRWPYDRPILRARDFKNIAMRQDFEFIPCYYKVLNVLCENNGTVRTCNIMSRGGIHISFLDGKTVREAKEELLTVDDCLYCYHLPQMEFSNLMNLQLRPVLEQLGNQTKEDIKTLFTKNGYKRETIHKP
jgi:MoaA/NifB/PqqE/SkfB family radical SAM enzyme